MTSLPARGSLLLGLAITIFVLSLVIAGVSAYFVWRDTGSANVFMAAWGGRLPTPGFTPTPTSDPLSAPLNVHPELAADQAELEEQLRGPLRAYYATKAERLGSIDVFPPNNPKHTTQVTYTLITPDETMTHTFFYDRRGKDRRGPYPRWEPGLLDNT